MKRQTRLRRTPSRARRPDIIPVPTVKSEFLEMRAHGRTIRDRERREQYFATLRVIETHCRSLTKALELTRRRSYRNAELYEACLASKQNPAGES